MEMGFSQREAKQSIKKKKKEEAFLLPFFFVLFAVVCFLE